MAGSTPGGAAAATAAGASRALTVVSATNKDFRDMNFPPRGRITVGCLGKTEEAGAIAAVFAGRERTSARMS